MITIPDPVVAALLDHVRDLTRQVSDMWAALDMRVHEPSGGKRLVWSEKIADLTGGLTPGDVEENLSDLERRIEALESGDRGES